MFVLKSTYESLARELFDSRMAFSLLNDKWNDLVDRINKKGGERFLSQGPNGCQFSKEELKQILVLCHPDKHGGSDKATTITKQINKIRAKMID